MPRQGRDSRIGQLLKYWRRERGLSQMGLALAAGVSARHLGFVELGRSAPSRELVHDLATALGVPLRERNRLLEAAGYRPVYAETPWENLETQPAGQAVLLMLRNHEPRPAVVMDRYWDVVAANNAARRLVSFFSAETPPAPVNFLRLIFNPAFLRPAVSNWQEVAPMLLRRVHHEALGGREDEAAERLLHDLLSFPGVPANWRLPRLEQAPQPVVPITFGGESSSLSFFSAITTLGTVHDITLQELRIEFFLPADEGTMLRCESLLA